MLGHNPVNTECVNLLNDCGREADVESVPSCGIVALEFVLSFWQQIGEKEERMLFFDYPQKGTVAV